MAVSSFDLRKVRAASREFSHGALIGTNLLIGDESSNWR